MSPARLLVPLAVCVWLAAASAPADERPNVILILADDKYVDDAAWRSTWPNNRRFPEEFFGREEI